MAITLVDTTDVASNVSAASPMDITKPTGITDDDYLIGWMIARSAAATIGITTSDDVAFTEIDQLAMSVGKLYIGYRKASSETGSNYKGTINAGAPNGYAGLALYRGVDTTTPFDVEYVQATHYVESLNDTEPNPAAVTISTGGAWVATILLGTNATGAEVTAITAPTNYTKQEEALSPSERVWGAYADDEIASTGSENPGAWTITKNAGADVDSGSFTIALRPAGGADTAAPDLTTLAVTPASITPTTATFTFNSDEAGTHYVVADTESTKPDQTEIQAGQNGLGAAARFSANAAMSSGANAVSLTNLVPGTTYQVFLQAKDDEGTPNQSTVQDAVEFTTAAAFSTSETHDGSMPGSDSILHYLNATAASGNATSATVTAAGWTVDEWDTLTLVKDADSSEGVISGNTSDTITYAGAADMTGGGLFDIIATIDSPDIMYAEGVVTVASGSVDIDWYIYDNSETTYSSVYTQTINGLSEADGTYTTALGVDGALTLTAVVVGAISASTSGTAANVPEATIVSSGGTVIITLLNDTWIAAGTGPIGTTAQSNAIVAGISASESPTFGWNTLIRDVLDNTDLVRTSSTVATLTVPATANYAPGNTERIVPLIPNAVLTTSTEDLIAEAFEITVSAARGGGNDTGGWYYKYYNVNKKRKRRRARR